MSEPDLPSDGDRNDRIREIVARCIEAREVEGDGGVERICQEHPELADEVRRRLAGLGDLGILAPPDTAAELSEQLGPYRILAELGRGGMGTVYLAEQLEPVQRQVALKVIKPGMESREVLARFDAERQALALMNHPGIANVFDAGITGNGRPYFVMEFVPGVSITEYCNRERLTTEERLRLFVTVCETVQHAHQKGIIHRDLKPSNVLVMEQDGRAVPKIIDFGVAKATKEPLTAQAAGMTGMGVTLGTPEYMSPEQAAGDSPDVDTRADIYSLGVMLYELLTETLPLDSAELRRAGAAAMERLICEEEPPPPSSRVGMDPETGATAAEARGTDLRALSRRLRGDLDWITLRALEKERSRRYQTTGELAADIERHLRHEPVLATPPSAVYRMRKLLRRYRIQAAAVGAVLLSLIAGLVVSLSLYFKAEANAVTAQQTSDFLVDLFEHANPGRTSRSDMPVGSVLKQGTERIKHELGGQPAVRARLLATFGKVYSWLGSDREALECLEEAVRLQIDLTGASDARVLDWRLEMVSPLTAEGRIAEAEAILDDLQARCLKLYGPHHRWQAICRQKRGAVYRTAGRIPEAGTSLQEAMEMARALMTVDDPGLARSIKYYAYWLIDRGEYKRALPLVQEAIELEERLFPQGHPNLVQTLEAQHECLVALGAFDEAEPVIERTLAETRRIFGDDHELVARALRGYAKLQKARGRMGAAEKLLRQAVAIEDRKRQPDRRTLAWCLNDLGALLMRLGREREAIPILRKALDFYERLFPGDHPHRAVCMSNLARAIDAAGGGAAVEQLARDGLAMHRRLYPEDNVATANMLVVLGHALAGRNKMAEAEKALVQACEIAGQDEIAGNTHASLALIHNRRGRGPQGEEAARKGLRILRAVHPGDHPDAAMLLYNCGWARDLQKDRAGAAALFTQSAAMFRRVYPDGHPRTAFPLNHHGWILLEKQPGEAVPLLREAMAIRRRTLRPGDYWWLVTLKNLSTAYLALGDREHAEPLLIELFATLKKSRGAAHPATVNALKGLVAAYEQWADQPAADKYRALLPAKGK